ncbi:MAG TPA: BTAD domain-containing putative transcriptional regulator [Polyangia bacterium]|nr:BTAD domain-containing putative transcriptional regulator [Polyangia bacterium]
MSRRAPSAVAGALALVLAVGGAGGCAHHAVPAPAGPGQALAGEASRIGPITFEDDFLEARLVFQALPLASPQRVALRAKLLHYLLDPVLVLKADDIRRETRELESDDVYDTVFASLRDALGLFDPSELWTTPARLTPEEARLIQPAAELTLTLFSPRGGDQQAVLALAVLATLSPGDPQWAQRLDQVVSWTEEESNFDEGGGLHRGGSAVDALESALGDWPAPAVVQRLDALYLARQKKLSTALRHPPTGDSARRALGELLLAHGDEMQRAVTSMAGAYLRAGRIADAAARTSAMAGGDGDDPELRGLLTAAARHDAASADYLALARRFLPRVDFLGGTASDSPDPVVAFRVLEAGLAAHPSDPELLVLSAHVSRLLSSYFLAIRRLEEAQAVLDANPAAKDLVGKISAELIELYFVRLRLRLDPERDTPAYAEADDLKRRFEEARRRFAGTELKVRDADIDFELARSYVNAGLIDRAEPLFLRARDEGEPTAEVTVELANLALKRGDPARATRIVREGIDALRAKGAAQDTIGSVEGRARLDRLLGDTFDAVGDRDAASAAWRGSLIGWERLMIEHLRRKNVTEAAEATVEVGKLLYLLGRRGEALQRFDDAIEADDDRDQSYIDIVAFLVQAGETDAALSVYHRGLARPGRAVSEYVKIYTSLWVLDLTRRTNKVGDPKAEAYLRTLDERHGELRPHRGAAWSRLLGRYAVGKIPYEQALQAANTTGKRAEIYFYEAMRRLEEGKSDDAHQLWQKVLETQMFSFFEFEMASRYLRTGAPISPVLGSGAKTAAEAI